MTGLNYKLKTSLTGSRTSHLEVNMTLPFMAGLNYKPKTSLTGSRTSHLDACPSMEHAYPSYAQHSTPDVTHKLGQVRAKFYAHNRKPMHSLFSMNRDNKLIAEFPISTCKPLCVE
jgi:hypothetical protein